MKSVPTPRGKRRVQYAALPYRQRQDGEIQIRLITSRETRRWVIPKGWPMKGLSPSKAAAREAYEEAGLLGSISSEPLGLYSYDKRLTLQTVPCDVMVFPLKVKRYVKKWPERSERFGFWFSVESAAAAVQEEDLRLIILAFGDQMAARFAQKRSRRPEAETVAPVRIADSMGAELDLAAKAAAQAKPAAKAKAAGKDKPAVAAKAKAPVKAKAPAKAKSPAKAKDVVSVELIATDAAPLAEGAPVPVKGKAAAKPKAKAKAAAKPKGEAKAKAASQPKADAKTKAVAKPKAAAKPKSEAKAKADAKPKAAAKPKADVKPKEAAKPKAAAKPAKAKATKAKPPAKAKGQRVVLADAPEANWGEDEASTRLPVLPGVNMPSTRH